MIDFIITASAVTVISRIFISKTQLPNKTIMSLIIGVSLSLSFEIIQLLIDLIINLIF